ncbi:MAG TPA: hypothetical protein VM263_01120, partial [Acidimicrobiales bacterium]|nr:hypothetical protein [Acidimicrobiales bacterium]
MSAPAFEVAGGRALRGRLRVPGDKSISHRALLLAALAEGTSHLSGLSGGDDVARTAAAARALGAEVAGGASDGGRAGHVVAAGQAAQVRRPLGQGGQQEGPVGDGLVAR